MTVLVTQLHYWTYTRLHFPLLLSIHSEQDSSINATRPASSLSMLPSLKPLSDMKIK
jgi:hypothetical protein